jgi:hypothetical protein
MIRLHKDAPWPEVEIDGKTINKTKWIEEDFNYKPIKKWVIFKEPEVVVKPTVDYSPYSKSELVKIAKEKGIDCTGLSKSQILEKLND